MRRGIIDIEADSLTPTKVHCIVFEDLDTDEVFVFDGKDMRDEFTKFDKDVGTYIGHNILGYDIPVLNRLLGTNISLDRITDTLIISRLLFTGLRRSHSLEAWGIELGHPKIEFSAYETYTPEMLTYCKGDVTLNRKLYEKVLRPGLQGYSSYCVQLEHKVQAILNKQRENGFYIDFDKVCALEIHLAERLKTLELEILSEFPPARVLVEKNFVVKITKKGTPFASSMTKLAKYPDHVANIDGTYDLYESIPFNLGSPVQIVARMNACGWKPVEFTDAGNPRVSENNFNTLPDDAPPAAHKLGDWLMVRNRLTTIRGWLEVRNSKTEKMHGTCIGIGAITHRMAHYDPQMANIPGIKYDDNKKEIPNYGREMRSCLTVKDLDKYCMVGVDISGIQLRILAHYLEDQKYTDSVCFGDSKLGTDIHSVHMNILREIYPPLTRDGAKKFIYSMLLGASGKKLGHDMGTTPANGSKAKEKLFERIPAFKRVKKMCARAAERGYMIGIDGRRTPVKSEHFALSVYLQCGEAVIMKQALVYLHERSSHIDFKQLAVVHDEVQCEVRRDQAEALGKLIVQCIEDAGKFFELRCPVTGGYKIGNNWAETH